METDLAVETCLWLLLVLHRQNKVEVCLVVLETCEWRAGHTVGRVLVENIPLLPHKSGIPGRFCPQTLASFSPSHICFVSAMISLLYTLKGRSSHLAISPLLSIPL